MADFKGRILRPPSKPILKIAQPPELHITSGFIFDAIGVHCSAYLTLDH
jgi:hypothetical protein